MPPAGNDQNLLHTARSFASDAAPLSAQFISHALPADFLTDLNTDIANFEAAINQQTSSVGTHISASASIDQAIANGLKNVKRLDAIVVNKYANSVADLIYKDKKGEWRWKRTAPNGREVGSSGEGYKNREDCVANARRNGYTGN